MRILLITPKFFNYHKMIIEELKSMGHTVDWFDDRPSTNGWVKAIIRVKRDLISYYIKHYFSKIKKEIRGVKYDVFFLVSGQSLSLNESMIKELRELQPGARFFLYQWDSIQNFPYIERVQRFFDRCYSFDRVDVSNTSRLTFLPLFYGRRFEAIGNLNICDYKYDFSFVGTAHPKKYKLVKQMSEQLSYIYKKQFIYYFFPSRIVYFYRKFHDKEMISAKYSEFHFTPLPTDLFDDIYMHSMCILDSPQAGQTGLTIRALEALGAKKKLITSNEDIVNYDFYRPENIYVYKGTFDYSDPFFTKPYREIPSEIYKKYSIRNCLETILDYKTTSLVSC